MHGLHHIALQRAYPVLDRVREKKLLTKTAESGLLSALADSGLTLKQVEALLPALEDAGLLSFAANNADFLLNTVGFLVRVPRLYILYLLPQPSTAIDRHVAFLRTLVRAVVRSGL